MKNALTYEVTHTDGRDYNQTYIRICRKRKESLISKIRDCRKDPAYYGKPDQWLGLLDQGYDSFYASPYAELDCTVRFQHYNNPDTGESEGYCSHRIEALDSLYEMQLSVKILNKLAKHVARARDRYHGPKESYSYALDNPADLVKALEAIGAQRVEVIDTGAYASQFVNSDSGVEFRTEPSF